MVFLYFLLNILNFLVFLSLRHLNNFYLIFNKFNLIFKKNFKDTTFFEKFILIFFYKSNWFFKSIFVNYDFNLLNTFKVNNYPLINFFSIFNFEKKSNFENLIILKKNYKFFIKNNFLKEYSFIDFIILNFFFYKKYFNLLNLFFYKDLNEFNLIKLNFLFLFFNKKNNFYKKIYNLNYYSDWFNYSFNKNNFLNKLNKNNNYKINFKKKNLFYIKNILNKYIKIFNLNKKSLNNLNSFFSNFFKNNNFIFFKKINIISKKLLKIGNILPIRFSETSLNKYINNYNLSNYEFYYLRKNKIFNKGRYSRNRQLYRTGVYWCLWLNILIVYGLYFLFYRFTFNFGYLWFGLFFIVFSTIFSRILKYKFYNLFYLYNEFYNLFLWFNFLLNNLFFNIKIIIFKLTLNIKKNLILYSYLNDFYYFYYKYLLNLINIYNKKKDYGYVYIWKNYGLVDKSLFKYKSVLNWFNQFYKVLVY